MITQHVDVHIDFTTLCPRALSVSSLMVASSNNGAIPNYRSRLFYIRRYTVAMSSFTWGGIGHTETKY